MLLALERTGPRPAGWRSPLLSTMSFGARSRAQKAPLLGLGLAEVPGSASLAVEGTVWRLVPRGSPWPSVPSVGGGGRAQKAPLLGLGLAEVPGRRNSLQSA